MYVSPNFKTKKLFREAILRGDVVTYFQPGLGETPLNGSFCVEGPHFPAAHTWYATCVAKDGKIISVK